VVRGLCKQRKRDCGAIHQPGSEHCRIFFCVISSLTARSFGIENLMKRRGGLSGCVKASGVCVGQSGSESGIASRGLRRLAGQHDLSCIRLLRRFLTTAIKNQHNRANLNNICKAGQHLDRGHNGLCWRRCKLCRIHM